MSTIEFLTAFGLGAIVTAIVQAWLANSAARENRRFDEKKSAYLGFLDAINESEKLRTHEAALDVGSWSNRIALVGSNSVISAIEKFHDTNPIDDRVHPDRPVVLKFLKQEMRKDLQIEKN